MKASLKHSKLFTCKRGAIYYYQLAQQCFETPLYAQHPHRDVIEANLQRAIDRAYVFLLQDFQTAKLTVPSEEICEVFLSLSVQLFSSPHQASVLHKQLGDIYLQTDHLKRSIEAYEASVELAPETSTAYHNLACCYHSQSEFEKADIHFQVGIAPCKTASILAEYAHFLVMQGRDHEALAFIEQCLSHPEPGGLSYAPLEAPCVVATLQALIASPIQHNIRLSAHGLVHYLQVLCHQQLHNDLQMTIALEAFSIWIENAESSEQGVEYFLLATIYQQLGDETQARVYQAQAQQWGIAVEIDAIFQKKHSCPSP